MIGVAVDIGDMQLLDDFADTAAGEDDIRLDEIDDLEEFEFVAVVDVIGAALTARDDLLEVFLVTELRRHGDNLNAEIVLDRFRPVP